MRAFRMAGGIVLALAVTACDWLSPAPATKGRAAGPSASPKQAVPAASSWGMARPDERFAQAFGVLARLSGRPGVVRSSTAPGKWIVTVDQEEVALSAHASFGQWFDVLVGFAKAHPIAHMGGEPAVEPPVFPAPGLEAVAFMRVLEQELREAPTPALLGQAADAAIAAAAALRDPVGAADVVFGTAAALVAAAQAVSRRPLLQRRALLAYVMGYTEDAADIGAACPLESPAYAVTLSKAERVAELGRTKSGALFALWHLRSLVRLGRYERAERYARHAGPLSFPVLIERARRWSPQPFDAAAAASAAAALVLDASALAPVPVAVFGDDPVSASARLKRVATRKELEAALGMGMERWGALLAKAAEAFSPGAPLVSRRYARSYLSAAAVAVGRSLRGAGLAVRFSDPQLVGAESEVARAWRLPWGWEPVAAHAPLDASTARRVRGDAWAARWWIAAQRWWPASPLSLSSDMVSVLDAVMDALDARPSWRPWRAFVIRMWLRDAETAAAEVQRAGSASDREALGALVRWLRTGTVPQGAVWFRDPQWWVLLGAVVQDEAPVGSGIGAWYRVAGGDPAGFALFAAAPAGPWPVVQAAGIVESYEKWMQRYGVSDLAPIHHVHVTLLSRAHRFDEAAAVARRASSWVERSARLWLADVALAQGRCAEAQRLLQAVSLDKETVEQHLVAAWCVGEMQEAAAVALRPPWDMSLGEWEHVVGRAFARAAAVRPRTAAVSALDALIAAGASWRHVSLLLHALSTARNNSLAVHLVEHLRQTGVLSNAEAALSCARIAYRAYLVGLQRAWPRSFGSREGPPVSMVGCLMAHRLWEAPWFAWAEDLEVPEEAWRQRLLAYALEGKRHSDWALVVRRYCSRSGPTMRAWCAAARGDAAPGVGTEADELRLLRAVAQGDRRAVLDVAATGRDADVRAMAWAALWAGSGAIAKTD